MTLVTYGGSLPRPRGRRAAGRASGIDAEVVDLRVLRPLDDATVLESVTRTHRAVVVDEGWRTGSLSAEIAARIMPSRRFYELDAPVERVCAAEVPDPLRTAAGGGRAAPGRPRRLAAAGGRWGAMG